MPQNKPPVSGIGRFAACWDDMADELIPFLEALPDPKPSPENMELAFVLTQWAVNPRAFRTNSELALWLADICGKYPDNAPLLMLKMREVMAKQKRSKKGFVKFYLRTHSTLPLHKEGPKVLGKIDHLRGCGEIAWAIETDPGTPKFSSNITADDVKKAWRELVVAESEQARRLKLYLDRLESGGSRLLREEALSLMASIEMNQERELDKERCAGRKLSPETIRFKFWHLANYARGEPRRGLKPPH